MSEPTDRRGRLFAGAVLILLGLALFGLQLANGPGDAVALFLLGGLFVAGYFYRRAYGLLIPGGILLGLGLGSVGSRSGGAVGDFTALGLGVGFVAIYVIALVYEGRTRWWPLVPGVVLILLGLGSAWRIRNLLAVGWPLILVLVGLLVLTGAFGAGHRRTPPEGS